MKRRVTLADLGGHIQKVALTKLVREFTGLGLARAKAWQDSFVERRVGEIEVEASAVAEFARRAALLGAFVRDPNGPHAEVLDERIEQTLTEAGDGDCRDIHFRGATWEGLVHFVVWVQRNCEIQSAFDSASKDVRARIIRSDKPQDVIPSEGYVLAEIRSDTALLRELQVYAARQGEGIFVELTFYPSAVRRDLFSIEAFVGLMDQWARLLLAEEYVVRLENAGWDFESGGAGVLIRGTVPPP